MVLHCGQAVQKEEEGRCAAAQATDVHSTVELTWQRSGGPVSAMRSNAEGQTSTAGEGAGAAGGPPANSAMVSHICSKFLAMPLIAPAQQVPIQNCPEDQRSCCAPEHAQMLLLAVLLQAWSAASCRCVHSTPLPD